MMSITKIRSSAQASSYYSTVNDYYAVKDVGEQEPNEMDLGTQEFDGDSLSADNGHTNHKQQAKPIANEIATSLEEMVALMQREGGSGEHLRQVFQGHGAKMLGIDGSFSSETFNNLLMGRVDENTAVGRIKNGELEHRPGWDLTFSAPKSVSVMALVGGDGRVIDAHHKAVKAALDYLEKTSCHYRLSTGERVQGDGFVVASFTHSASRNLDPQLHTHNVVMNLTGASDGTWKSLEPRELYKNQLLGGQVYRAELANVLQQELGYKLSFDENGLFEIDGVPKELLQEFSSRRAEIEKMASEQGLSTPAELEAATLKTRRNKIRTNTEGLVGKWLEDAGERVSAIRDLVAESQVVQKILPVPGSGKNRIQEKAALADVDLAIRHLAEREAVFTHDSIIKFTMEKAKGGYTYSDVESALEKQLSDKKLIRSKTSRLEYTTQSAVDRETFAIRLMQQGQSEYKKKPIMSARDTEKALRELDAEADKRGEFKLNLGQRRSFSLLMNSPDQYIGIQGGAGTGKTYSLAKFNTIAKSKQYNVRGFAPTGSAAEKLFLESGIPSETIDSLRFKNKNILEGRKGKVPDLTKEVWIVDEAGMANAKQVIDIMVLARKTGARVAFQGDGSQLGAIEWGKLFILLRQHGMTSATLDDVMRQKSAHDKAIVKSVTQHEYDSAFENMGERLQESKDRAEQLVTDWSSQEKVDRDKSLIICPDHKTGEEITKGVREFLQNSGELSKTEVDHTIYLPDQEKTEATRTDSRFYKSGQILGFSDGDKQLGVSGEFTASVVGSKDKETLLVKLADGKVKEWNPKKAKTKSQDLKVFDKKVIRLAVGDKVVSTVTSKGRGIKNGDKGEITAIKDGNVTIKYSGNNPREITIPLDEARNIKHDYVTTVYRSQGLDDKNVYAVAESFRKNLINRKSFYVMLTRHKEKLRLYTDSKKELLSALKQRTGEKTSALESQKIDKIERRAREIRIREKLKSIIDSIRGKNLSRDIENIEHLSSKENLQRETPEQREERYKKILQRIRNHREDNQHINEHHSDTKQQEEKQIEVNKTATKPHEIEHKPVVPKPVKVKEISHEIKRGVHDHER